MTRSGLCPQGAFQGQPPALSCASHLQRKLQACLPERMAQEPSGAMPGVSCDSTQALEGSCWQQPVGRRWRAPGKCRSWSAQLPSAAAQGGRQAEVRAAFGLR